MPLIHAVGHVSDFPGAVGHHMGVTVFNSYFDTVRWWMIRLAVEVIIVCSIAACGGGGGKANDDLIEDAEERNKISSAATGPRTENQYMGNLLGNRSDGPDIFNIESSCALVNRLEHDHSHEKHDIAESAIARADVSAAKTAMRDAGTSIRGAIQPSHSTINPAATPVGTQTGTSSGVAHGLDVTVSKHDDVARSVDVAVSENEEVVRRLDVAEAKNNDVAWGSNVAAGRDKRGVDVAVGEDNDIARKVNVVASKGDAVTQRVDAGVNTSYMAGHEAQGQYTGTVSDNQTFTMVVSGTGQLYTLYFNGDEMGKAIVGDLSISNKKGFSKGIIYEKEQRAAVVDLDAALAGNSSFIKHLYSKAISLACKPLPYPYNEIVLQAFNTFLSLKPLNVTASALGMPSLKFNGTPNLTLYMKPKLAMVKGFFKGEAARRSLADEINMPVKLELVIDDHGEITGKEGYCQFEGKIVPFERGNAFNIEIEYQGDAMCQKTKARGIGLLFGSNHRLRVIMQTPSKDGILFNVTRDSGNSIAGFFKSPVGTSTVTLDETPASIHPETSIGIHRDVARGVDAGVNTSYMAGHEAQGQYTGTVLDNQTFTMVVSGTGQLYALYFNGDEMGKAIVGDLSISNKGFSKGIIYEKEQRAAVVDLYAVLAGNSSFIKHLSSKAISLARKPLPPSYSEAFKTFLDLQPLNVTVSAPGMPSFEFNGTPDVTLYMKPKLAMVKGFFKGEAARRTLLNETTMPAMLELAIDDHGKITGKEGYCQFEGKIVPFERGNAFNIEIEYQDDDVCFYPKTKARGIGLLFESDHRLRVIMQTPSKDGILFNVTRDTPAA